MKALICPNTVFEIDGSTAFRVAEVEASVFDVAEPLFWVDCPDTCVADQWYYDPASGTCIQKPEPESQPEEGQTDPPVTPVEVLP
jgi:hypothetical protein